MERLIPREDDDHVSTVNVPIDEDPVEMWLGTPFPPGSANDVLDEIHAELVTVDTLIAGIVLTYRDTGDWISPVLDVMGELSRLREAILAAQEAASEDKNVIVSYIDYVDLLTAVYRARAPF